MYLHKKPYIIASPRRYLVVATIACITIATASLLIYTRIKPKAVLVETTACLNATVYKNNLMAAWNGSNLAPDKHDTLEKEYNGSKAFLTFQMKNNLVQGDTIVLYNMYVALTQVVIILS